MRRKIFLKITHAGDKKIRIANKNSRNVILVNIADITHEYRVFSIAENYS